MRSLKDTVLTRSKLFLAFSAIVIGIMFALEPVQAQNGGAVQELTGQAGIGKPAFFLLPNLKKGDTLYIYASGESGNLDPLVALGDESFSRETLRDDFLSAVNQAINAGRDPLEVVPEFANQVFLAWDDDSGRGYDSAFEFTIPTNGNYQLFLGSTPASETLGDYRLLIGLNAPQVLTGQAEPTGDTIAFLNEAVTEKNMATEEVTGTLTDDKTSTFFVLNELKAGDTVYAYAEATSGDLAPVIIFKDFGNKPLANGNFSGRQGSATLEYTVEEGGNNYRLDLIACCDDGHRTTGDYRLLVGVNNPAVLTGQSAGTDTPVIRKPIEVQVGMIMEQITSVDQKSENFGAVVDMQMRWNDPRLTFSPDECQCRFQTFTLSAFDRYLTEKDVQEWPEFTLFNQQGRRDSQNQIVAIWPNGDALYVERFSATLQAPDFNFERFPFDTQQFYIRIKSVFPEEFFVFTDMEGFSAPGQQLGEEEWVISDYGTSVDAHNTNSRFSFGFTAYRHLSFYIFRIFVPVIIIIIVSWFTFFLKDYGKRVDVASANLLLFIAFNFTISNDLPRLGYLTLMDTILVSTFVVTALVVMFNVYLKRLEVDGKQNFVNTIDKYMIWIYPLAYFVAFAIVSYFFA